jgi:hypothetical protein
LPFPFPWPAPLPWPLPFPLPPVGAAGAGWGWAGAWLPDGLCDLPGLFGFEAGLPCEFVVGLPFVFELAVHAPIVSP